MSFSEREIPEGLTVMDKHNMPLTTYLWSTLYLFLLGCTALSFVLCELGWQLHLFFSL